MEPCENVLTVTQLTREIREVLEGQLGSVWVEGEISNHRLQSSGHQYFTLKDAGAQLACVMFRGAARSGVKLTDGAQVQVYGEISVYELRGQYQMVVRQVQLKGQGSLQARFEALKQRLYAEGLFDPGHKREIPRFPRVVALVTSPTGAAIQDMLNILSRRAPWVRVLVYPVRVQGQGVEAETIRALEVLNNAEEHGLPRPDTIVVGRGGGSLEDLWAYNEEALARAIYASEIPVISAVGHEIDFTIADFVADLRAPTPSAAAELLAPDAVELKRHFEAWDRRLRTRVRSMLDHYSQVLELTGRGALAREPERWLEGAAQAVDEGEEVLRRVLREALRTQEDELDQHRQSLERHHPRLRLSEAEHQWQTHLFQLQQVLQRRLDRLSDRLQGRADLLRNLGPTSVLARGFSYTTDTSGKVLKSVADARTGSKLITHLADGRVTSVVVTG